jgi:beta-N-acetylhexosaminidase
MDPRPEPAIVSRRTFLRGMAAGGIAAFLAACAPAPLPSPVPPSASPPGAAPSPASPSAAGSSLPAAASATAAPAATPTIVPTPDTAARMLRMVPGLLVVGFRGATLGEAGWVRSAIADDGLGGVILFDRDQLTGGRRNIVSPAQVRRLTGDLRAAAPARGVIVAVDQEGGVVTRLSPAHGYPAVASEATIGRGTAAEARTWAKALAATLADAGINLNMAPVVDLDVNPTSPAIGALGRSFSADAGVVVAMATIEIDTHRAAGVRTALKHFPGIGSSTGNTDFGVVDVSKTWSGTELEPFRRLVAAGRADLIMAGHVVNAQIDAARPASLSRGTLDVLRGDIGWKGIVVTDDLQAAAITQRYGADEALLLALEAGNDLLLLANQQVYEPGVVKRAVTAILGAVAHGRIPGSRVEEAWTRVQATFGKPAG